MNHTTPAIVPQSAVRRLPRLVLFLLCMVYVLPGFLGREPWKLADISAFGVMLDMAAGHSSWWEPSVLGVPVEEAGPLPYWLGAAFIRMLPFLSPEMAVRIPFVLILVLTLVCTWSAAYHLARQRSAQPVAFAFGGEAQPLDYARTLADASLLALLACLGLAQLSHETTPDLARLCASSVMLLGAAKLANPQVQATTCSIQVWSLGAMALVFSGAPWIALLTGSGLLVMLASLVQPGSSITESEQATLKHRTIGAAVALFLVMGVALLSGLLLPGQMEVPSSLTDWRRWGQLLVWFTWPAWPLVLWTLWRWRRQLNQPHLALPLCMATVSLLNSAINPDFDRALLLALPALAVLAAFALPTLSRSVSALIDWFTLLFFTGCASVIWIVWIAMTTGVPVQPAANVAKLAPSFVPVFAPLHFAAAMLATIAWIALVTWRVGAHRQALWKSLVLPAGGTTLCWLLLMSLWLPLLDHSRSYGPLSRRVAALVTNDRCVLVNDLNPAQVAALQYHGGLQLVRIKAKAQVPLEAQCNTLVTSSQGLDTLATRLDLTQWIFLDSVWRLDERREHLLVYRRLDKAATPSGQKDAGNI